MPVYRAIAKARTGGIDPPADVVSNVSGQIGAIKQVQGWVLGGTERGFKRADRRKEY
jgi:hypothetical protein